MHRQQACTQTHTSRHKLSFTHTYTNTIAHTHYIYKVANIFIDQVKIDRHAYRSSHLEMQGHIYRAEDRTVVTRMSSDTHRYVALNNICVQDTDRHTNTYTRIQLHSKHTDTHTGTCSNTSHKHTYSQPGVEGVGLVIRAEYHSV